MGLSDEEWAIYEGFMYDVGFHCWCCGWDYEQLCPAWHLPALHNAHILGGACRTHDRRNLTRLCEGCHRLAHGATIKVKDIQLPNLTLPNMLWLKKQFDPKFYDRKYLEGLRGQALPRAKKIVSAPQNFLCSRR